MTDRAPKLRIKLSPAEKLPPLPGPASPLARIWLPRERTRCVPAAFWAGPCAPKSPGSRARPPR